MLLTQIFKTIDGAHKRARFENAHCNGRYNYQTVRCIDGKPDPEPFSRERFADYTWRLNRETRKQTA
jgi:hypothetical protein